MSADIFQTMKKRRDSRREEEMSLPEFLERCKDPETGRSYYANASERMLEAIGPPEILDTRKNERLGRIFLNRKIKVYPTFSDFYGMEETIENVVSFFKHAAQGLEEARQVLYLLGPVGGGKSSIAERLKELMQRVPVYVLKAYNVDKDEWETSPCFEHPFGLFDYEEDAPIFSKKYDIPKRYFKIIPSPWATKRLEENENDYSKFKVVKMYPSMLRQQLITKVEPGDENNQDISSLVGKVNIRELEDHVQHDPDAYNWAGGMNVTNQGILEFVEMFKAPLKMLHPLLTATQEGNYNGTEQFGAIPFQGIILAHCFSEDTELLTHIGWKGIDEIEEGDIVATLNRDNDYIEYQPAKKKFVYDNVDEVYHMSSSAADHLVTANHKMIYESFGNYKEVKAQDFFIKGAHIPVSGFFERESSGIYENDNEIRLHAWCITDGNLYYERKDGMLNYRFHLKKKRKIDRLISLVEIMNLNYSITENEETIHIRINGINSKFTKFLTEKHRKLSPLEFNVLLDEWSHTDGSRLTHRGEDNFSISTNVKFHVDLIQELCVLSGHKTTYAISDKKGYDSVYAMSIRKNTSKVRCDVINKGTQSYNGRVWCLETSNHTLIARRNGKVMITGNSNESEWQTFRNNKNNEAFLDRVNIIQVPYCLRVTEEEKIYQKLIDNSDLSGLPCAPGTLHMMAQYSGLTRLVDPENSNPFSKLEIYDGKNLKSKDPKAKSIDEYREVAGINEGMSGSSTRFAFKILSKVFNYDSEEIAANPIHLMHILEKQIIREQLGPEEENRRIAFIRGILAPKYAEFLGDELQKAYLESYKEYGQNIFDRYIQLADFWVQDKDYRDTDTGEIWDRDELDEELQKIEKPAGVTNVKDFRSNVVGFVIRHQAKNKGKNPDWTTYEKLREVIEKKMFANTEDLLPVISFGKKQTKDEEIKHNEFVKRMTEKGYTTKQVRLMVEWHLRYSKSN